MDYQLYKIRKAIGKVFDKLIKMVFYIPAWLYKNNRTFHKFIETLENKSYIKSKKKYLAKKVFRDLEKSQKCIAFLGTDYDGEFDFDLEDLSFDLLLSDEKWIKRNKLNVDIITLEEYIKKHTPDRMWSVRDYNKDKTVYIISK